MGPKRKERVLSYRRGTKSHHKNSGFTPRSCMRRTAIQAPRNPVRATSGSGNSPLSCQGSRSSAPMSVISTRSRRTACSLGSERASKHASKQSSKQNTQARSKQARTNFKCLVSKQASKHIDREARKHYAREKSEQASTQRPKETIKRASRQNRQWSKQREHTSRQRLTQADKQGSKQATYANQARPAKQAKQANQANQGLSATSLLKGDFSHESPAKHTRTAHNFARKCTGRLGFHSGHLNGPYIPGERGNTGLQPLTFDQHSAGLVTPSLSLIHI